MYSSLSFRSCLLYNILLILLYMSVIPNSKKQVAFCIVNRDTIYIYIVFIRSCTFIRLVARLITFTELLNT
jgi:hypothetical protein